MGAILSYLQLSRLDDRLEQMNRNDALHRVHDGIEHPFVYIILTDN